MRIADLIPLTEVEGPGTRAALWVQGCSIRCPGCCNPAYLDPAGGRDLDPVALADELAALPVEGLTLLGGEPLDQAPDLLVLLRRLREHSRLGVILFTGHPWAVVQERFPQILPWVDLVKAGPFEAGRHPDSRRWIGSANQTVHALTPRYRSLAEAWPAARREIEIHLRPDAIVVNGTPLPGDPFPTSLSGTPFTPTNTMSEGLPPCPHRGRRDTSVSRPEKSPSSPSVQACSDPLPGSLATIGPVHPPGPWPPAINPPPPTDLPPTPAAHHAGLAPAAHPARPAPDTPAPLPHPAPAALRPDPAPAIILPPRRIP